MSSPFLNKLVFFPKTPSIQDLEPYMYLEGREFQPALAPQPEPDIHSEEKVGVVKPREVKYTPSVKPGVRNTLFWSVFMAMHEYADYLDALRRSGNREIEEKVRMVDSLKKSPKILKETNAKLTLEQTQALYGSLLTSREDRIEFCAAYTAFYKRTIWLVYPKTYRVYSPTVDASLESDAIVIRVEPGPKHTFIYSLDQESDIKTLIGERTGLLNAQSKYKMDELVAIAGKIGVTVVPKAKKQEVYDAIRVAIHNDMHFGGTS
jgi:hypothetical protein